MVYLKIRSFDNDKPIIYGMNKMTAPFGVQMSGDDITADSTGIKKVNEGMFLVGVGNKVRFLPRTRLKLASATNSAQLTLKTPSFQFLPGDVLYATAGYARVTFSGTLTAGDVYVIKIGDTNYSVTAPGSPTLDSVVDAFITDNTAALTTAGITVRQIGTSGTVEVIAKDSYAIDTLSSSGTVELTVNSTEKGYLGEHLLPLGTIQSIATANTAGERVVTLVANAAYVLPAETPVGVRVTKYLGIYPLHLDFTEEPNVHLAPITGCDGVYEHNLPYCDEQLKRVFHQLNINKRFYRNV